jgi:hypothetical protein
MALFKRGHPVSQHLELLEDLTREFDIAEAAGGDELPVANGGGVHVLVCIGVAGDLRTQVLEPVAGVTPASQEPDSG